MSKGDQTTDYLNVNNVIKIIIKILKINKSDVINICSGRPVSLKNLVKNGKKRSIAEINYGYYKNSINEVKKFWGSTKN